MTRNPRPCRRWCTRTFTAVCLATLLLISLPAAAEVIILANPVYVEGGMCIKIQSTSSGAIRVTPRQEEYYYMGYIEVGWDRYTSTLTQSGKVKTGDITKARYMGEENGFHTWSIWISTESNEITEFRVDVYENGHRIKSFTHEEILNGGICSALD